MQSEATVEIDRPIDEVFDFTTKHVAEWSITVVEDEVIDEKPEGVGTTFRSVCEDPRGRRMEFRGTVTRHEPPTLSAVKLEGKSFDIETTYEFSDLGGSTRVTQTAIVHPRGFTKVMFGLLGWLFRRAGCKAAEDELLSLKDKLEARQASPAS